MKKFVCPVCGYVYEGDSAPEKCPQCGVPGIKVHRYGRGRTEFRVRARCRRRRKG